MSGSLFAQSEEDFYNKFVQLCNVEGSGPEIEQLLTSWDNKFPEDAELFIARFNHYLILGEEEVVRLDNSMIYSDVSYNQGMFNKAISELEAGLELHPKRLDMWFGKSYALGQNRSFYEQKEAILELLDYSEKIEFEWQWKKGETLNDAREQVYNSVQDYVYTMFNTSATLLCDNIIEISDKMISLFPNDKFNYSNVGSCYLVKEDYDKAINYLNKAKQIDEQDPLILYNIGYSYMKMKEDDKAIYFFNQVIDTGNQDYIDYANQMIEKINNKKP